MCAGYARPVTFIHAGGGDEATPLQRRYARGGRGPDTPAPFRVPRSGERTGPYSGMLYWNPGVVWGADWNPDADPGAAPAAGSELYWNPGEYWVPA